MKFLSIAKKEIKSFLNTPTFYVVAGVFFLVTFLILFFAFQYLKFGTADTTQLFNAMAITMTFIVPTLTMGAFAREKGTGTYEYLLTIPVKVRDIILGKFTAYLGLISVLLLLTIPFVLSVGLIVPLDLGQVFAQYVGIVLFASALLSLGIWVSTFFNSEIPSFLITLILSLLLILGGTDWLNIIPTFARDTFQNLSILFHYQSLSNGVFDIKDLSFFAGFILIFFVLAHWGIKSEILSKKSEMFKKLYVNLALTIVLGFGIIFLFQNVYFRIDLTSDKRYSLSEATKNIVSQVPEEVSIKFYTSGNLPGELQSTQKSINDLLTDYARFLPGKIDYERINTSSSEDSRNEASDAGLQEILFQINSEDSSQSVVGYFGIVIDYKGTKEVINITSASNDLEFQITTKIKALAGLNKLKIGVLATGTKHTLDSTYTIVRSEIGKLFDFEQIKIEDGSLTLPEDLKVLLIPSVNQQLDDSVVNEIKAFFERGGSIMLLQDTLEISETGDVGGTETEFTLAKLFSEYGIEVNNEVAYDLLQNNVVSINNGLFQVPIDYPFWILPTRPDSNNEITQGAPSLPILWSNSLTIGTAEGVTVTPLYVTSTQSNTENKDTLDVSVQRMFSERENDKSLTIAASLEKGESRAIVVGDSDVFSDDIITSLVQRDSQDQLVFTFLINSLEWLSKEQSLTELRSKIRQVVRFTPDEAQISTLFIAAFGLPIASVIVFGSARNYLRKRRKDKVYEG